MILEAPLVAESVPRVQKVERLMGSLSNTVTISGWVQTVSLEESCLVWAASSGQQGYHRELWLLAPTLLLQGKLQIQVPVWNFTERMSSWWSHWWLPWVIKFQKTRKLCRKVNIRLGNLLCRPLISSFFPGDHKGISTCLSPQGSSFLR